MYNNVVTFNPSQSTTYAGHGQNHVIHDWSGFLDSITSHGIVRTNFSNTCVSSSNLFEQRYIVEQGQVLWMNGHKTAIGGFNDHWGFTSIEVDRFSGAQTAVIRDYKSTMLLSISSTFESQEIDFNEVATSYKSKTGAISRPSFNVEQNVVCLAEKHLSKCMNNVSLKDCWQGSSHCVCSGDRIDLSLLPIFLNTLADQMTEVSIWIVNHGGLIQQQATYDKYNFNAGHINLTGAGNKLHIDTNQIAYGLRHSVFDGRHLLRFYNDENKCVFGMNIAVTSSKDDKDFWQRMLSVLVTQ